MDEEEFLIEQLLDLKKSYERAAEPIIKKLVAIRARDVPTMFLLDTNMAVQNSARDYILKRMNEGTL